MTSPNQPPPQPPKVPPRRPIDYAAPAPSTNTPGRFFIRMLLGTGAGVLAMALGGLLAYLTPSAALGGYLAPAVLFLPIVLLTIAAGIYTILKRRFGYVTGIITGIIVSVGLAILGLIVLIIIICGKA